MNFSLQNLAERVEQSAQELESVKKVSDSYE